jgi:hypothetical protein
MRVPRLAQRRFGLAAVLAVLAVPAAACTGHIETPGGRGDPGTGSDSAALACAKSGGTLNAGVTPLRRLTRDQYNNTVHDLLGATGQPADNLADDEKIGPFHSNAIAPITDLEVQQHQEVAASLALAAIPHMAQISPCDLAADTGTTCATQFISQLGGRAYRRPLAASEVQQYVALYTLGQQGGGAQNGFRLVVEAMLQSPFFLYHHDFGGAGTPQPGVVPLTAYELASRISYFILNSMPDAELFAAAAAGTLGDDAALTRQAQRLLASPGAGATIGSFHRQWLDVEDVASQAKDPALFPQYGADLAAAMLEETGLFSDYVVRGGDGLLETLLTSNVAFPQGGLFAVYGVPQPPGFSVGSPVALDANQRAGILTQAAFLTKWSHNNQTSPVHRGKLVRLNLLCGFIGSPPPNVNTTPPPPTAATSTRERFAQHESDPVCASCHVLMDPIGLGFEHYDPIGAYRDVDGLGAVDATGDIVQAGPDLEGTFDGALELAGKLARSTEVRNCVANQWFRFSMGRMESTDDSCSISGLHDAFRASGGNIRDLIVRVILSPSFRNVRLNGD